jgi:hypothetical protein
MYKYYEKSGYDVMAYDFSSITEFIDYLDTHRVRTSIFGYNPSSEQSDYEFTETRSLQEAKDLCRFGYHKDFDKLVELKYTLENSTGYS